MPAIKEQVMKESLYLNDKSFPVIGAPKEKIPFDEMIGERIPGKLSRKRSNNSLERKNSITEIDLSTSETEEKTEPMEQETETVESVSTMSKSKKKRLAKKRKMMAVKLAEDSTLSQEGQHFQTFCRKHFSVIVGRLGKSNFQFELINLYLL